LTQILDRPLSGRIFFEEIIRENLDLGRPDKVHLIFNRRVMKRTPGHFRTRVLTHGVIPSLLVDYKNSRSKQYFKQALLSNICGLIPAQEGGQACDRERFPWLRKCENRTSVW